MGDVDDVVATIEAQQHQRFLKSHLPFDAPPYDPAVRYICVGRDTRDVFMSVFNHYSGYTELTYSLLDAAGGADNPMPRCPATERELWADWMTRSLFESETDGWPFWSHHHHAAVRSGRIGTCPTCSWSTTPTCSPTSRRRRAASPPSPSSR